METTRPGTTSYAIALGSNRRHGRHGDPRNVVEAAVGALAGAGLVVTARSRTRETLAMGGAGRRFANAVVIVETSLFPPDLLVLLKRIERVFGRRTARRWAPRVLDLDILWWSEGPYRGGRGASSLSIPHEGLATRAFVLEPLLDIVPNARHPLLGRTFASLLTSLRAPRPVDRLRPHP